MTTPKTQDDVRNTVRDHYAKVATAAASGCCAPGCCGSAPDDSLRLGYTNEDLLAVPEGSNMGLGCGNPQALAALQPGETVVDLGSGGGFDCFLAARKVGSGGKVIGIDMTAEMISKARANAEKLAADNVEFRLGEIEYLPIADGTADVILSNCVINLSPSKAQVFRDAFRVLKAGGRLAISDVVALEELPASLREHAETLSGCVAGAATVEDIQNLLAEAGFEKISLAVNPQSRDFIRDWFPGSGAENYVASASIEAIKPSGKVCCGAGGCGSPSPE